MENDPVPVTHVRSSTADVTFGSPAMPIVPQRSAMQSLMFGNNGLGVPKENPLQLLLLAHENHIDRFFDLDTQAGPDVEEFLQVARLELARVYRRRFRGISLKKLLSITITLLNSRLQLKVDPRILSCGTRFEL